MVRYTNPSGFVKYDNEEELCQELEKYFFPIFFDRGWRPQLDITKEVWLNYIKRIDYFGYKNKIPTWIEVKNWWVTKKEITQIQMYYCLMKEPFNFYLICGGIEGYRRKKLEELNIKIILIKDLDELNPRMVIHWM